VEKTSRRSNCLSSDTIRRWPGGLRLTAALVLNQRWLGLYGSFFEGGESEEPGRAQGHPRRPSRSLEKWGVVKATSEVYEGWSCGWHQGRVDASIAGSWCRVGRPASTSREISSSVFGSMFDIEDRKGTGPRRIWRKLHQANEALSRRRVKARKRERRPSRREMARLKSVRRPDRGKKINLQGCGGWRNRSCPKAKRIHETTGQFLEPFAGTS